MYWHGHYVDHVTWTNLTERFYIAAQWPLRIGLNLPYYESPGSIFKNDLWPVGLTLTPSYTSEDN